MDTELAYELLEMSEDQQEQHMDQQIKLYKEVIEELLKKNT